MARAINARAIVGKERFKELNAKSDGPGLIFLGGHLVTMAATGYWLWFSLGSLWAIPAIIVHGVVIVHWFSPFHESSHGTAFRTPWLNWLVNWWSGLLLGLVPGQFLHEHAHHHAFTQDPEQDPERIPMGETLGGYFFYATGIPYFRGLLRTLFMLPWGSFTTEERHFIPARELPIVRRQAAIMCAIYAALAIGSVWLQTWDVVLFWLLPRVAGEPVMRLIRMSEHVGCPLVPDLLQNTRTVRTFFLPRWLAWNNAYHAEHHNSPMTPFHALPALHAILSPHLHEVREGYLRTQVALLRNAVDAAGAEPARS